MSCCLPACLPIYLLPELDPIPSRLTFYVTKNSNGEALQITSNYISLSLPTLLPILLSHEKYPQFNANLQY